MKTAANLVRQPHGGALAKGGYRGNRGGGRPPSALREAFRGDLETARARIAELLEDPDTKPSDIISIFDKLAKYGVGERKTVSRDELGTIFGAMWDLVVMHNNIEDPTDRLTAIQNDWSSLSA